jgi:phosphatidylinositol glycan class N
VDQGVEQITKLIDNFYNDGKTAYVFTADHGMSDWGSHGDGHPDNTRTPLIAWGAGVAGPKFSQEGTAPGHEDKFSSDWNLDQVHRHDVAQADIAALMAYLAGLEFPVNSVGELPLSYLAADPSEKAKAALVNAREVLEMYKVKESHKQATALRYSAYPPFAKANQSHTDRIALIESTIKGGDPEHAIVLSDDLLQHAIQGLRYLQTYDWLFLRALITTGYLGFMTYAATTVIDLHVLHRSSSTKRTSASTIFFSSILVLLYASFIIEKSPFMYYAYAIFPVLFWEEVFARRQALFAGTKVLFSHIQGPSGYLAFALESAAFVAVLQALVSINQRFIRAA